MADNKPTSRSDFQIAIICALELEAEAVLYLFDRTWDGNGDPFGKAARDPNHYRTGQLGKHNVVLVTLPGIGKVNAATAAAALLSSYTNIRLALIVGICGGVPSPPNLKEEILLGDVVISDAVVQFDFGRRYPDGNFHIKSNIKERLGKADNNVKSLLKIFGTQQGKDLLECGAFKNLKTLQKNELVAAKRNGRDGNIYSYPGITKDKRYKPLHVHRHRKDTACGCTDRHACQTAREESCESLGCEDSELLVTRTRRLELKRKLDSKNDMRVQAPSIFMGAMASGDTVMKSGEDRDRIAKEEGVIAFEMEGAGVWEQPYTSCLLIKGVCDYADSHKNKDWQYFAAATAAAVMKALLGFCARAERPDGTTTSNQLQMLIQSHDSMIGKFEGENKIMRETIALMQLQIQTLISTIPALQGNPSSRVFFEYVLVIDAREERLPIPLQTITSKEGLIAILKIKFQDIGYSKIEKEEWVLEDQTTGDALDLTQPWTSIMKHGQVLNMSMIFWRGKYETASMQCPFCHSVNDGPTSESIRCLSCDLVFRRIEEVQDIELHSGYPMSNNEPATPLVQKGTEPMPKSAKISSIEEVPQPQPTKRLLNILDDIKQYKRVQIIDTRFQLQKQPSKAGAKVTIQDLSDHNLLGAYLAQIYGLPEEDCLRALKYSLPQLVALADNLERPPRPLADNLKRSPWPLTDNFERSPWPPADNFERSPWPLADNFKRSPWATHRKVELGRKSNSYFTPGKTFIIRWAEMARKEGTDSTNHSEIVWRRMIIIGTLPGHHTSTCVEINTYGGKGLAKRGIDIARHAVLFDARLVPHMTNEEGRPHLDPLAITIELPGERLDPMSRANFGKIYTIAHDCKIRHIGRISANSMPHFDAYVNEFWRVSNTG